MTTNDERARKLVEVIAAAHYDDCDDEERAEVVLIAEEALAAAESRGRAEGAAEERRRAGRDAVLGRAVRAALGEDGARTISYAISAVGDTRTRSIAKRRGSVASVMVVLSCNDAIAALTAIGEAVQADAERGAHETKEGA